jgi:hypothetical protein
MQEPELANSHKKLRTTQHWFIPCPNLSDDFKVMSLAGGSGAAIPAMQFSKLPRPSEGTLSLKRVKLTLKFKHVPLAIYTREWTPSD